MDASTLSGSEATAVLEGLDVDHGKLQRGKGALGSRENPETYENVPGHVIPILADEFDDFTSEAGNFLAGEQGEDTFIPFRLKQGVYGQRQADVQMIRVKLPFGGVVAPARPFAGQLLFEEGAEGLGANLVEQDLDPGPGAVLA